MDWYPLYNSLRIALISTVIIFFAGIAAAYYVARLPRVLKGVLDVLFTLQGLGKCLRQHFLAGFVRSVQYICMGYFIHFYCIL